MKASKCPVCDWEIKDVVKAKVGDRTIAVCCADCAAKLRANPKKYKVGK